MTITANSKILQIVRADTTYDIALERLLTPAMRSIIAPSHPESVMICQHVPEHEFDSPALCIYDRSRTISPERIDSWFSYNDAGAFTAFSELAAPRERLYAPVFYYSANAVDDEMYYDGLVELAEPMRGRGIAKSFYMNIETILRECGFRFLSGWHGNLDSALFFIRGGRLFLEEMVDGNHRDALENPEGKDALLSPGSAGLMIGSIRCLQEGDEVALVKPELRKATLDQRLSLLKRVMSTKTVFMNMTSKPPGTARDTIIGEILQTMRSRGIDVPQQIPTTTDHLLALLEHTYEIATRFTQSELDKFIWKLETFLA